MNNTSISAPLTSFLGGAASGAIQAWTNVPHLKKPQHSPNAGRSVRHPPSPSLESLSRLLQSPRASTFAPRGFPASGPRCCLTGYLLTPQFSLPLFSPAMLPPPLIYSYLIFQTLEPFVLKEAVDARMRNSTRVSQGDRGRG